jgi:hypothetical protein
MKWSDLSQEPAGSVWTVPLIRPGTAGLLVQI